MDLLFSQLEEREPDHFAVKQYRKFKMAAGKTLKSILISCGARLAPFDIKELRDLFPYTVPPYPGYPYPGFPYMALPYPVKAYLGLTAVRTEAFRK